MSNFQSTAETSINQILVPNYSSPYNLLNDYSTPQTENYQQAFQNQGILISNPTIYNPYQNPIQITQTFEQEIIKSQLPTEIKNLDFHLQKKEFINILGLLIVSSILEYFIMMALITILYPVVDQIAVFMFPISLILLILIAKFSVDEKITPLFAYLLLTELTSQTLLFFSRLFDHTRPPREDGLYFTTADVILIGCVIQIGVNGFVTLCTLIYLLIENKNIQYLPVLVIQYIFTIFGIVIFWPFAPLGLLGVLYGVLLINGLRQISQGRVKMVQILVQTSKRQCIHKCQFSYICYILSLIIILHYYIHFKQHAKDFNFLKQSLDVKPGQPFWILSNRPSIACYSSYLFELVNYFVEVIQTSSKKITTKQLKSSIGRTALKTRVQVSLRQLFFIIKALNNIQHIEQFLETVQYIEDLSFSIKLFLPCENSNRKQSKYNEKFETDHIMMNEIYVFQF